MIKYAFSWLDQMKSLCKTHFLQMVYRKTDGATLLSQNERNLDCALTFQTHSILQRFLVRFDSLQLDCNDHLYIYDGAHATGTPKVNYIKKFSSVYVLSIFSNEFVLIFILFWKMDISCRNTKQSAGNIITQSNFLTLKYVTDGWGTDSNGFKLVLTAIKNISKLLVSLMLLNLWSHLNILLDYQICAVQTMHARNFVANHRNFVYHPIWCVIR